MTARELPSGTVTLLFTDIEGSTRMLQELGREAYVRALTAHRRLLRDAFTAYGGVEVEMQGDSFHFAFPYARDAVAAAVAGQRALQEHAWESEPIRVRMGLHTGEPMQADGLYAGLDVHSAARVMSAGHGGQILVSHRTAEIVTGELPEEIRLLDLGEHRLKDIEVPQRIHQVGENTFQSLNTLSQRRSLPVAASPLIGRERELAELTELLRNGSRLVTVTATGGAGKTRLAVHAASNLGQDFQDGVAWVPLSALTDAALVLPAIAQALGAHDGLERWLAERKTLLVLDNFEHLLDAAAAVASLLSAAPGVKALVTSRSPLQVDGEHEYHLEPLADAEAVALFVERCRTAGREVEADSTVLEVCRRLDNLPLAIELAAARSKLMAPEALLGRLEQRLPLLTAGRRDAPTRHRSLRETIDWSHELLDEPTRALFARLAVFAGDFSLDAAQAICAAGLDQLQALVDLSLLRSIGPDRFVMLETVREYAAERLAALPDESTLRRCHAEWFGALAHGQAQRSRESNPAALALLESDEHNFRAALACAVELELADTAYELIVGLWFFFVIRGHLEEFDRWVRLTLALPSGSDARLRAQALAYGSEVFRIRGDHRAARKYKEEAIPRLRAAGMESMAAATLADLAAMTAIDGSLDEAEALALEALAIRERLGVETGIAHARGALAEIAFWRGRYQEALDLWEMDLSMFRALGRLADVATTLASAGGCLRRLGALEPAAARLQEALEVASAVGDITALVEALRELAAVTLRVGDARTAAVMLGGVERMIETSGLQVFDPTDYLEISTAVREALDVDECADAWTLGGSMGRSELVETAMASVRIP